MALPEGSGTKEAVGPGGKGNVFKNLMGPQGVPSLPRPFLLGCHWVSSFLAPHTPYQRTWVPTAHSTGGEHGQRPLQTVQNQILILLPSSWPSWGTPLFFYTQGLKATRKKQAMWEKDSSVHIPSMTRLLLRPRWSEPAGKIDLPIPHLLLLNEFFNFTI